MAAYVYGIIEANSTAPDASGIGGAPLRVIGGDGAAALVSDIPAQDVRLGRDEMLTHERVLEAALSEHTVLPMRFGVVMEADDVRERLLGSHGEQLRAQLAELAGKVEMNVRAVYDEDAVMREIIARDPRIGQLRAATRERPEAVTYYDRIQLGELVAQALEHTREADADTLLRALEPAALAVRVASSAHERVALNASFLIARDGVARFDEVLEGQASAHAERLRFKCVGPLPPHSFVDLGQAG